MNVLVVAAHPDDEVLGCGGTIARHTGEGDTVDILILGEGLNARGSHEQEVFAKLHAAAQEASAILGVRELILESFPDNRMDSVPLLDVVARVETVIDNCKPQVIYTHSEKDLNIDHNVVFRAVLTATRTMGGCPVKSIYAYEVPSSTEWGFGKINRAFNPNYFINIDDYLSHKLSAMAAYEGESRSFPHPRSLPALEALARWRGASVGYQAAEAFELVRHVR